MNLFCIRKVVGETIIHEKVHYRRQLETGSLPRKPEQGRSSSFVNTLSLL